MTTITWHVVLLGCATHGLTGVAADLRYMQAILEAYGISPKAIETHPTATAAAIRDAFERLIARVGEGDGVLVFYSGHGLRLIDETTGAIAFAIVPVAHDGTDDFPYILREELTAYFWRLTAKTRNVTWVADCCHAAGVYRTDLRARALPTRSLAFAARRDAIRERLPPDRRDAEHNPDVVRVCACADTHEAFEDERGGLLTRSLARSLADIGHAPIAVEDLGRVLVRRLGERQQPVVAGPVDRGWLTARPHAAGGFATLLLRSNGTLLVGGRLLDQRVGDHYLAQDDAGSPHALVITKVKAHRSMSKPLATDSTAPLTATVRLWHTDQPRGAIEPTGPLPPGFLDVLTASGYLARAGTTTAPVVARVGMDGTRAQVQLPWGMALPLDDLTAVHAVVDGLARQAALLALATTATPTRYTLAYDPTARSITVTNRTGDRQFVTILSLEQRGSITLVTRGQPDGEGVDPAAAASFPIPPADLRGIVAIIGEERIDLRGWTDAPNSAPSPLHSVRGEDPWFGVHAFS